MELIEVKSSNIAEVGYAPNERTMRVVFRSGSVYDYLCVSQDTFDMFLQAQSKGQYLNFVIKPFHAAQKTGREATVYAGAERAYTEVEIIGRLTAEMREVKAQLSRSQSRIQEIEAAMNSQFGVFALPRD